MHLHSQPTPVMFYSSSSLPFRRWSYYWPLYIPQTLLGCFSACPGLHTPSSLELRSSPTPDLTTQIRTQPLSPLCVPAFSLLSVAPWFPAAILRLSCGCMGCVVREPSAHQLGPAPGSHLDEANLLSQGGNTLQRMGVSPLEDLPCPAHHSWLSSSQRLFP